MPETIDHYRLEAPLGSGGMGTVYRAFDTRLERTVALKFPVAGAERARLLDEARLASGLNHPHICVVYEVGETGGRIYIAMEHVAGRPLSVLLADRLGVEAVLRYGIQITDALAHAHARGVLHCDLKSSNVIVTPEDSVKVLDFGLARRMPRVELDEATRSHVSLGPIAGTLAYLAPELLLGQPADARSDLWALGVLLYEMASGELPFQGRTPFEVSAAILRESPRPLPARVPEGLRSVMARCLEKEPARRYQEAVDVQTALEAVRSLRRSGAERPRILVVEDEPAIAFGLQMDLEMQDCDVVVESDGESALSRARRESFDLILLDVMLPHRTGFEICRELRRGGSTTPIILLTARSQESERIMGLELGADDYVTKPFSPGELRARIKAMLRREYRFGAGASSNPDDGADSRRTIGR